MPIGEMTSRERSHVDVAEAPPRPGPRGPAADKPDYRPALDGLRALAVAGVILYHLGYLGGGFLGVDLFFVLSGYLITGLLVSEFQRTAQISVLGFWARRVRRLYPGLIPVIVAVLIYATTLSDPAARSALRGDVISSLFYFSNWHFAAGAESYFAQFTAPSPLRHFWSLAIEEQFYVVWPLVVALCMWLGRRRTWLLATAAAIGALLSALLLATLWNAADPSAAYYSTFARAHELLIGALLALLMRRRAGATSSSWWPTALAGAGGILVVVAFAVGSDTGSGYYHGGSVLFCLLVVALIAGVERVGPNPVRDLLSLAPARYVGRISYALYLWHWPIILWVTSARVSLSGPALNVFRIVVMTAAAAASTHLLEEPIRRGRLGRWLTVRRIGYALAAVSLVMVAMTLGMTQGGSSASARSIAAEALRNGSGDPASDEQQLAAAESQSLPPVHRVAVFGDSVPEMLKPSFEVAGRRDGLKVVDAAIGGCGVVAMTQTDAAGNVVSWQETCDSIAAHERAVMRDDSPDAVIWYSGTENEPMLIDGTSYPPGTPQHRRALRRAMIAAHDRLTAHGAQLYLVKLPPHGPPPGGCADPQANPQCAINETFNSTVPYLNDQLRWLARSYDDTTFVSLDDLICPGGPPCPTTIHDVAVRPDGTHFSDVFAPRVASTLLADVMPGG